MAGLMHHVLRLGLSLSLMDREAFVKKVSEFLEKYKDDPEQMEKIAKGLYQYLDEMRTRMDMKDAVKSAVDSSDMPDNEDVRALTKAIEDLTREIQQQKQTKT